MLKKFDIIWTWQSHFDCHRLPRLPTANGVLSTFLKNASKEWPMSKIFDNFGHDSHILTGTTAIQYVLPAMWPTSDFTNHEWGWWKWLIDYTTRKSKIAAKTKNKRQAQVPNQENIIVHCYKGVLSFFQRAFQVFELAKISDKPHPRRLRSVTVQVPG